MLIVSLLIAAFLVAATFILHFVVLGALAKEIRDEGSRLRWPLLTVIFSLFLAHVTEVFLYSLAFFAIDYAGLGGLDGFVHPTNATLADHFYFSIASYTTLGIGDIIPFGVIRLVAGFEALNGLILIAWSASFTYLMMERLWVGINDSDADPDGRDTAAD